MEKTVLSFKKKSVFLLPQNKAYFLDALYRSAKVESVEYTDKGILVTAVADEKLSGQLKDYTVKEV